ncbi:MAG: hypothetical protein ABFS17_01940 [Chloroflexota bacterium]
METTVLIGLILFTFALLIYTIATWAGVKSKILKKWHMVLYWLGFTADFYATFSIGYVYGGFQQNFHSYLGAAALLAILAQNIAGTNYLIKGKQERLAAFPKKISFPVWVLWIASYIAGLILSGGSH